MIDKAKASDTQYSMQTLIRLDVSVYIELFHWTEYL